MVSTERFHLFTTELPLPELALVVGTRFQMLRALPGVPIVMVAAFRPAVGRRPCDAYLRFFSDAMLSFITF